jgi:hypothetical protein
LKIAASPFGNEQHQSGFDPHGHEYARDPAQQREQQSFSQPLTQEPEATGAQRQSHRTLRRTHGGPCHHQVCEVGTEDQQDYAGCPNRSNSDVRISAANFESPDRQAEYDISRQEFIFVARS